MRSLHNFTSYTNITAAAGSAATCDLILRRTISGS